MNRWLDNFPYIGKKLSGKIVLSLLLLLLSGALRFFNGTVTRRLCAFGMFLSFLGDYILNYNSEIRGQSRLDFLYGGFCFIVAHLFYFATYFTKIFINKYRLFNLGMVFGIVLLALIVISIIKNKTVEKESFAFKYGLVYLWLTGVDFWVIFSYAYSARPIGYFAMLGGLLFLASDVIIEYEKVCGLKSKHARELVWWFYPIGQFLLIIMA
jgi:uncharacterized membrane protein YhhN